MFSQTCVILSVHREGVYPTCNGQRWCASQHAMGQGGVVTPRTDPPSEKATEAGGTHPTGMHSCLSKCLRGAQHCSIKWSTEAFVHA